MGVSPVLPGGDARLSTGKLFDHSVRIAPEIQKAGRLCPALRTEKLSIAELS